MTDRTIAYRTTRDNEAANVHYRQCEFRRIPYVEIHTRAKFCDVVWDRAALPSDCDDAMEAFEATMWNEIAAVRRKHPKTAFGPSNSFVGLLKRVPREAAESVARAIFDILNSRVPRAA